MIITGKMLSFGTSGTGNGGNLTTVKTDGITITGDGNTTPLALGPGEKNSIGTYVMAYCAANRAGTDAYGDAVPGSMLQPAGIKQDSNAPKNPINPSSLPGTWRLCAEAWATFSSIGLYQRIA
ncbi:TPA: hypothetical protein ACJG4C_003674 [Salmonella enterica subsp. diarizonae serovar 61:r:z53]